MDYLNKLFSFLEKYNKCFLLCSFFVLGIVWALIEYEQNLFGGFLLGCLVTSSVELYFLNRWRRAIIYDKSEISKMIGESEKDFFDLDDRGPMD